MLPCFCSEVDHRGRQNVVRTSVTDSAAPLVPLFCSYDMLTSSVTSVLNRRMATWNLFVNLIPPNRFFGNLSSRWRKWEKKETFDWEKRVVDRLFKTLWDSYKDALILLCKCIGLMWFYASDLDITDRNERLRWQDWRSSVILQPLLISIGLMVIQQFCGVNAVLFNAASIFSVAGFKDAKLASISVGLIQFFGTALACLLMDRAGRRILLWTMALGMCITLAGLGFYFEIYIPPKTDGTTASDTVSLLGSIHNSVEASKISWLSILCLVLFNLAFALAWGPIPWLVMSEIFPLKARGPASSLATLSNWLLAFVVTKTYSNLQSELTIQGTFWFYSGCSLLGFVFVFFVMPETKGKTLEEIEAMFNKGGHAYQPIDWQIQFYGTITLRQVKYFVIIPCWSRFVKEAKCSFACLTDSYCVPTLRLDIPASIP